MRTAIRNATVIMAWFLSGFAVVSLIGYLTERAVGVPLPPDWVWGVSAIVFAGQVLAALSFRMLESEGEEGEPTNTEDTKPYHARF